MCITGFDNTIDINFCLTERFYLSSYFKANLPPIGENKRQFGAKKVFIPEQFNRKVEQLRQNRFTLNIG